MWFGPFLFSFSLFFIPLIFSVFLSTSCGFLSLSLCISVSLAQVSGRIMWCRQLYRRMEAPMLVLREKLDLLKVAPQTLHEVDMKEKPNTPLCI